MMINLAVGKAIELTNKNETLISGRVKIEADGLFRRLPCRKNLFIFNFSKFPLIILMFSHLEVTLLGEQVSSA